MNTHEAKIVIETALLCAQQPMTVAGLRRLFADELDAQIVRSLLEELRNDWHGRGVALVSLASGWRFQTVPAMAPFLERIHGEKPPKYSRAVLETLAIVAYRQPVTRGDIEEIRGVSVSSQIVRVLEDRGWIEVIGHKDVIGRPSLFATTRQFLDDLGLESLEDLPSLDSNDAPAAMEAIEQRVLELERQDGAVPQPVEEADADRAADLGPDPVADFDADKNLGPDAPAEADADSDTAPASSDVIPDSDPTDPTDPTEPTREP